METPTLKASDGEYDERVYLSWSDMRASNYKIYRSSEPSGNYTQIGWTTSTKFDDTDISKNSIYYYKVKAVYHSGYETPLSPYDSGHR